MKNATFRVLVIVSITIFLFQSCSSDDNFDDIEVDPRATTDLIMEWNDLW